MQVEKLDYGLPATFVKKDISCGRTDDNCRNRLLAPKGLLSWNVKTVENGDNVTGLIGILPNVARIEALQTAEAC
jgi:hypothetical protein